MNKRDGTDEVSTAVGIVAFIGLFIYFLLGGSK